MKPITDKEASKCDCLTCRYTRKEITVGMLILEMLTLGMGYYEEKLVNRDYEGEIKNSGDTVNIRTPGTVSYVPYTGAVTYQDNSPILKENLAEAEAEVLKNETNNR